VNSKSANDPTINILELFGDSETESGGKDKVQPNYIQASIWSDNEDYYPGYKLQPITNKTISSAVVDPLPTQRASTEETTPMDIALNNKISEQSIKIV